MLQVAGTQQVTAPPLDQGVLVRSQEGQLEARAAPISPRCRRLSACWAPGSLVRDSPWRRATSRNAVTETPAAAGRSSRCIAVRRRTINCHNALARPVVPGAELF